jgi:hypothetical protein
MAIQSRGNSHRVKIFEPGSQGKRILIDRSFTDLAEAKRFHAVEKARLVYEQTFGVKLAEAVRESPVSLAVILDEPVGGARRRAAGVRSFP